jgi:hypothetical protein
MSWRGCRGRPVSGCSNARRGRDAALAPGAQALVEDVTTLLEAEEGWQAVCRRTRRSPQALEKALHRAGRGDLITALKTRDSAGGGVPAPRRPAARPPPTSA